MKAKATANLRTCVLTRKKLDKKELIRCVLLPDKKTVQIDLQQNIPGRGLYFAQSETAISQLMNRNLVAKIFKVNVPKEWYENLLEVIGKQK